MEHRMIGSLSVSVVGLGCNNFGMRIDEDASAAVVHAALDAGVDLFDTADVYGGSRSEEYLGRALAGRRDEVVVATKFGAQGSADEGMRPGSPEWVRIAADRSLARLGTDRIDLYQQHFPDPEVPIEDTLGALGELVEAGKVREIGCSNFSSAMIEEAENFAVTEHLPRFRTVQNRYSVLHRRPEPRVIPTCRTLGLGFIPYFPLESGLLSGKYRAGEEPPEGTRLATWPEDRRRDFLAGLEVAERLRGYAESRGHSLLELAISWLVTNPVVVSVIAGATKPDQVRANVAAAGWPMTPEERAAIDEIAGAASG